jgi:predicted RNase H-like nuclease
MSSSPADAVAECRKFKAPAGYEQLPKIFGVDVARFGDDKTVVFMRQGRKSGVLGVYRGLDTAQVTAHVIEFIEREQPDAVVVDSDGIGNTVFDQLKFQGYGKKLYEFHGGKPANNHSAYFNRRAEIWGEMRDALKAGMQIPDDPELAADLTGPQYGFSPQQQIQLEKKDDMKKRGLSPPTSAMRWR